MTTTLRFYNIMELLEDDERIAAFLIAEHCNYNPRCIYKQLLRGNFCKYIEELEEALSKIEDVKEYCKDTVLKAEMSRDPLFVITDFEHFEVE